ncbi:MAG: hypothetical protein E6R03_04185 [Hyphomicrobiaceae bacterium]|nr:MAG: hypothetical protein E6R03_04185 [Hyphomicrobiaceae bacterium]
MTLRKKPTKAAGKPGPKKAARKPKPEPYVPKTGEHELVMLGVCAEAPEDAIMSLIGGGNLTREQFRAAFANELTHGKDIAKIKVMASLYIMATSRIKGLAPTSAIFLTKMLTGMDTSAPGQSATATVKVNGTTPKDGEMAKPDPTQIIEVSFKIGDDSRIKDE